MTKRKANIQTLAWYNDLRKRDLLDLDPAYQRRSVWNQDFRDYFIDTILLRYPCPAIFLYEEISPSGSLKYSVVDGKQRLSAMFDFVDDKFPVSEEATITALRGMRFSGLSDETRVTFWQYEILTEYLPTNDEAAISGIFERLNRNIRSLSRQELRHARYSGVFIRECESLAERLLGGELFPARFPQIAERSQKQMKDVEFAAELLLLIENGPCSPTQDELDKAFSDRDHTWEKREDCLSKMQAVMNRIAEVLSQKKTSDALTRSRLRNQADFYSLVGAIDALSQNHSRFSASKARASLLTFLADCEGDKEYTRKYVDAARSASSDTSNRRTRIESLREVLKSSFS